MSDLSHFDADGKAHMVDVSSKEPTKRVAIAKGRIEMKPETLSRIRDQKVQKGNVLEIARLAGIMGSKRTSDLVPLCHPISISSVRLEFAFSDASTIEVSATVEATDRTGVEMEALTSVTVAALTIYDMCKSVDREMTINDIRLTHKSGGKSGTFDRDPNE